MKKIFSKISRAFAMLFLSVSTVHILPSNVLAGDQYYELMIGAQDSLVLGKVIKSTKDSLVVEVNKTLNGKETGKTINLDQDRYTAFKPNDFILASLDKSGSFGNSYKIKWGTYKVTSLDYRKLKIVPPDGDSGTVGWFINTGSKKYDGLNITRNLSEYHGRVLWDLIHKNKYHEHNLVLATVISSNINEKHKNFDIEIKKVLNGQKINKSKVTVRIDYLSSKCYVPKAKDNILIDLDNNSDVSRDDYIFQVSSLNYKDLKIISSWFDKEKEYLKALEWYIHSDAKDNDFYFPDGELFVKKSDNSFIRVK